MNGNTFDPALSPDHHYAEWILIQTHGLLHPTQRQDLYNAGIDDLEYVYKNTYLCKHVVGTIYDISQLPFIVGVGPYPADLKVQSTLQQAMSQDGGFTTRTYNIEVFLHQGAGMGFGEFQSKLLENDVYDCQYFEGNTQENPIQLKVGMMMIGRIAQMYAVRLIREMLPTMEGSPPRSSDID